MKVRNELSKLTLLPMCDYIAQLVEHRTGISEITGSNPVELVKRVLSFWRIAHIWLSISSKRKKKKQKVQILDANLKTKIIYWRNKVDWTRIDLVFSAVARVNADRMRPRLQSNKSERFVQIVLHMAGIKRVS